MVFAFDYTSHDRIYIDLAISMITIIRVDTTRRFLLDGVLSPLMLDLVVGRY